MSNDCTRAGEFHMHSDRCYEAGRREVVDRLSDEDMRVAVASALDWEDGPMWRANHATAALAAIRAALDGDR